MKRYLYLLGTLVIFLIVTTALLIKEAPNPQPLDHPDRSAPDVVQTQPAPLTPAPLAFVPASVSVPAVSTTNERPATKQASGSSPEVALENYPRLANPAYRAQRVRELTQQSDTALERARRWAARTGEPMRIETNGAVIILVDYTEANGPLYRTTFNANAAISTAADVLRSAPYTLSGAGITAGLWDGGNVRATHQEFALGRVTNREAVALHDHSTHVAGTMIALGINAAAKGMASNAVLHAYEFNNDQAEMTSRAMATPGESGTFQISNHSYGYVAGWSYQFNPVRWYGTWGGGVRESDSFGAYSTDDRSLDTLLYDAPYYLPFKAAGNDRTDSAPGSGATFAYYSPPNGWVTKTYNPASDPLADQGKQGGYDTIPLGGTAKNIVLVGAVNDAVLAGSRYPANGTMASFSSWGPTDDGRIKPDLVANGVGLYSSSSAGNTSYVSKQGTSMATPNASGSALLLLEHYGRLFPGQYMRAATIKALLIHTADDLYTAGPDFRNGWGLMNTKAAADHLTAHRDFPTAHHVTEAMLATTNPVMEYAVAWDNSRPLKATLVWTDPAGVARDGLNNTNLSLVNDLDLRIIDPSGTTNFPWTFITPTNYTASAVTGDNFRDNVEQVLIATPPTAGVYVVRVTYKGPLENNFQHYSLMISGHALPLQIDHTPLQNTSDTENPYLVDAWIAPTQLLENAEIDLFWTDTDEPYSFTTTNFTAVSNALYRAIIPPQTAGTTIRYYIQTVSPQGLITTDPPNAPATLHVFELSGAVDLTITGTPAQIGFVTPAYGSHTLSSGNVANVSAVLFSDPESGQRYRNTGWTGTGSAPASGSTQAVSFVMAEPSTIDWQWTLQHGLSQSSSVPGLVATESWWDDQASAETITAPTAVPIESQTFMFAEWRVDNVRQTNALGIAVNPASGFLMTEPREALAVYYPRTQDTDGLGLPDWWQIYYYGSLGNHPTNDLDADGFSDEDEYLDGTDPLNEDSVPAPPVIDHTPLTNPQGQPAPWLISATVTDNYALVSATLSWNRNASGWIDAPMTESDTPNTFTNQIPDPGITGDAFVYQIVAQDALGLVTTNGPHGFNVTYPRLMIDPPQVGHPVLQPGEDAQTVLTFANPGHTALTWSVFLEATGFQDDMEEGTGNWISYGIKDSWHLSTNRAWSGAAAWYGGIPGARSYAPNMNAALQLPPVTIYDASARFTFRHWIQSELDTGSYAWDGGLIAISTNNGASFFQIVPEGGYPYLMISWAESAFPHNTPIYAGVGEWQQATFDLGAYAGQTLLIRFQFGSDTYVEEEGWYIDDVRVTPRTGSNDWLLVSAQGGSIDAGGSSNWTVWVHATNVPSGEDRNALLGVESDDPTQPLQWIPVGMSVRSPPVVYLNSASQTSTNGAGQVTVQAQVFDPDREWIALETTFSTNQGVTWAQAWIDSVFPSIGSATLSNEVALSIHQIATAIDETALTNALDVIWSTIHAPAIALSTNTLLRLRAWDGRFWSGAVTSTPFPVDNEPPSVPTGLWSPTHTNSEWSMENEIIAHWDAASDGDGIGVAGYGVGTNGAPLSVTTSLPTFQSAPVADGTNVWIAVRAVDSYGNVSAAAQIGPFKIDATPPSSTGATVSIASSEFGAYTLGTTLTSHWDGFTDTLSGLAGWYVSLSDGAATTNGQWVIDPNALVENAVPDQTNTVYVWARDIAGNLGASAHKALLVLAPESDQDADGMSNLAEEIAGTSSLDNTQSFAVQPLHEGTEPAHPTLQWPHAEGRVYTLYWSTNRLTHVPFTWHPVVAPAYAVTNGTAVWVDTNALSNTEPRYYRIEVRLSE